MALTAIALVVLAGCRTGTVESDGRVDPGAQPAPPNANALPANSLLEVEMNQTLSTDRSNVGDRFTARVTNSIVAANGQTVIPAGAVVTGVITGLDDSDYLGEQAAIRLDFESISFGGRTYALDADVVEADLHMRGQSLEDIARSAGIGAVAGAVLGTIIGGDLLDALEGAALGAGAGSVISLGLGDVEAELPRGSDLVLRTTRTINLR